MSEEGPLAEFSLVLLICGFHAVRGTSLILGNAGSMLVHAHDGDIDHLPAPIASMRQMRPAIGRQRD
jgi:hypothetical protein